MAITVKTALNRANPGELADLLRLALFGTFIEDETTPIEEAVAVAANVGTLANIPGKILAVYATAAGTTGVKALIPSGGGVVVAATQVQVAWATGVLTFAAADAVTAVRVTYTKATAKALIAASVRDLT